jgi:hypothetical protein
MRNTLPLSSLPLQVLLSVERYYQWLVGLVVFVLVLFKTYNLPYTAAMGIQEGILLLLFLGFMQGRVRLGIGANKVLLPDSD